MSARGDSECRSGLAKQLGLGRGRRAWRRTRAGRTRNLSSIASAISAAGKAAIMTPPVRQAPFHRLDRHRKGPDETLVLEPNSRSHRSPPSGGECGSVSGSSTSGDILLPRSLRSSRVAQLIDLLIHATIRQRRNKRLTAPRAGRKLIAVDLSFYLPGRFSPS